MVGVVQDGKLSTPYQFVFEKPAEDWMNETFDDKQLKTGLAPSGNESAKIRTEWKTLDIY